MDGWTAMCGQNAESFTCMVNGNKNVTVARVAGESASTPKVHPVHENFGSDNFFHAWIINVNMTQKLGISEYAIYK